MRKQTLGLIVPTQSNEQIKELTFSEVQKWLTNLQTADTIELINQLILKLQSLNASIIEPEKRFDLLELFQPLIKIHYELLRKRYINQIQPLSQDKLKIIELSRNIHENILIGYKIIIENINLANKSTTKDNILANTIYRSFKHFNKILDSYYQSYTEYADNIWKEIHIIYKYASECKIINAAITVDQNQYPVKLETITPYKQALFIASVSPYEWRQTDQQIIYNYSLLWNEHIIVRKFAENDLEDKIAKFFVPLNEDLALLSLHLNKSFSAYDGLTLDLTKLIDYLKNNHNNINQDGSVLADYSIKKLIKRFTEGGKRKSERFNILGNIYLTLGFPATHYYINKKRSFNPENIGNEIESNAEELELGTTVLDEPYNENEKIFKADKKLYTCRLININGEGSGIMFEDIARPPIQPIEIIAMSVISDHNNLELEETCWNIGTIRWLKYNKQEKLMAGVEIFAPFAVPAAIQLIQGERSVGYFQRAFLFNGDLADQFAIITPTGKFETNTTVKIYSFYHKKFIQTKLKEELISNNNFKCFNVDLIKLPHINKKSN